MRHTGIHRHPFLTGGGEASRLIAAFDWASTALGPIAQWPATLKASIALILRSPVPIVTLWGVDGIMIYNDAYSRFAGARHPALFGSRVREGWPEVADFNDNVMKVGLAGGTLAYRDQELTLFRSGAPEQVWMNLDYSPLLDEAGKPAGVMAVVVETTDKVRLQRELDSERESLGRMFQQAPGFVAVVNGPQHEFAMANQSYLDLVGRRDVLGRNVEDVLPEVGRQSFVELLDRVYQSGEPYVGRGVHVSLRHSAAHAAEERYLDFVYQPITRGGVTTGIFIQGHDVTEQKRTELALRGIRLVAENAPVMLWMGDAEGRCLYLNRAQRDFWGVTRETAAGFDWLPTVHPDDYRLLQPFKEAMAKHAGFSIEMRMRRADGMFRVVRTNAEPRFRPGRKFVGMIGVNVDVTEARQHERAVRRETRKLAVLNRSGAAVAAELDVDRIVQIVTDACTELVGAQFGAFFYNPARTAGEGYTRYALSGAPREAFAGFSMPRATAVFGPTFRGEEIVRSDDILQDPRYGGNEPYRGMPEGHLPVRSYLAVPVTSRSGEVIGGLFFGHGEPAQFKPEHEELLIGIAGQAATAIDNARLFRAAELELSERRRAEAALQTLNATLEQRVIDEVNQRAKTEEQLRQVQKMEAVGQLTGGIAHDFNNMLAVIIGGLSLLQRKLAKGQTDVERFVEGAVEAAERAADLTQRLLAFSRQQPLAPRPLDANQLVSSLSELFERTLGEGIKVRTMLATGLWRTEADPVQLENAILNLAVNARDATPAGGTLTIETSNAHIDEAFGREFAIAPGHYVLIVVSDSGAGMEAGVIAKAFDPFFTTKGVGKGTGLGLSQVYGFVRQSGGHVKIYSEPGVGTAVKIYLPRYHGPAPEPAPAAPVCRPDRGLPTEIVMVVEDEARVRAVSVAALRELGYGVTEAAGPLEALRMLQDGQCVSLLFTDLVMPDMSGRELADRACAIVPGLRVLYTTGYTRNAVVHNGMLDSGTHLLTKPFTIEDLGSRVRRVLDEQP